MKYILIMILSVNGCNGAGQWINTESMAVEFNSGLACQKAIEIINIKKDAPLPLYYGIGRIEHVTAVCVPKGKAVSDE